MKINFKIMKKEYDMHWEYQNEGIGGNDYPYRTQYSQVFFEKQEAWQECFNMAQSMSESDHGYWKAWVEHPDGTIGICITPG